jgi:hypothetical protein
VQSSRATGCDHVRLGSDHADQVSAIGGVRRLRARSPPRRTRHWPSYGALLCLSTRPVRDGPAPDQGQVGQGGFTLNASCRPTRSGPAFTLRCAIAQSGGQGVAGSSPVSLTETSPDLRKRGSGAVLTSTHVHIGRLLNGNPSGRTRRTGAGPRARLWTSIPGADCNVNRHPHVSVTETLRLTHMNADPSADRNVLRPLVRGQRELSGDRRGEGAADLAEGHEEGVPLTAKRTAVVLLEDVEKEHPILTEVMPVVTAHPTKQRSGALDVAEEEGDHPRRERPLRHVTTPTATRIPAGCCRDPGRR